MHFIKYTLTQTMYQQYLTDDIIHFWTVQHVHLHLMVINRFDMYYKICRFFLTKSTPYMNNT
jgi:hypothetical protein